VKAETIIGLPSIVVKQERPYLGVRFETPFEGMFAVVTKEMKEMRKWAKNHDLSEQGPEFLRYFRTDMKGIMEGEGRIKKGSLPTGKYATLTYRGNGLRGNQALLTWTKKNGIVLDHLKACDEESFTCRYEAYLTDYRIEPRKLLWDVELSIKLADSE